MSPTGTPSTLRQALQFPDGFIREIVDLIADVWASIVLPKVANTEVPMTNLLYEKLKEEYEIRDLPWYISLEQPEVDTATGSAPGRTDIRFLHRDIKGQRVFFVIEAKRLNIVNGNKTTSNATAYVDEGMFRFVNGHYSKHLPSGAMLGYVMNGNIPSARDKVSAKIKQHSASLLCESIPVIVDCPEVMPANLGGLTRHDRLAVQGGSFTIYHLFLAVEAKHFN